MKLSEGLAPLNPNGWPVRARLAAVSAILTFLILLCFAFVVGRLAANKLDANFQEEAQSAANEIANRLQITISPSGAPQVTGRGFNLDEFVMPQPSVVWFVDGQGSVLRGPAEGAPPQLPAPGQPETVDDVTTASQQILTNAPVGEQLFVQVVRDRASLEATTERVWLFLAIGVLGGTVLAALAGMAIAQRAMRPISSLTAAAREVATTRDPSRRLPRPQADDEVGELAQTLDEMLRELDAARSETEQMVQAQREFVADASHELRTPLTSILANLELLEARLSERGGDSEDAEIVAAALGSSLRMRRLVSDLLLLARADAGRPGPRRACDLVEIAGTAVNELAIVSGTHSLAFEAEHSVPIECNPDDVHRVVANLVENAVRHTPPGTNVLVNVYGDGTEAVIDVSDDGPGLPPGAGDQLFSRFVRGHGPADLSADPGTGLGLAIVRAVASAHGGGVAAKSGPNGGARFTVRLPLTATEATTSAAEAPAEPSDRPTAGRAAEQLSSSLYRRG